MFRFDWTQTVTVPIRRVGERWECFYGGDVPVEQGALAELTIRTAEITDELFIARMTQTTKVKILEEGTPLMVALSDRSFPKKTPWPDVAPEDVPQGTTRFERIVIGPPEAKHPRTKAARLFIGPPESGGLWLRLKGLERSELTCSTVLMPDGLQSNSAVSLNHAFTLLSKTYETHRISNTGNVYRHCFYQESDDRWYPLDDLRTGVRAQSERTLINAAWSQIEQALGWRPVTEGRRKKK
ncbi:hypothetical protein KAF44_00370 [Cupriavidus necator]|nr:hypothetical protein KAF44_00370 [Cupriavidus necator]